MSRRPRSSPRRSGACCTCALARAATRRAVRARARELRRPRRWRLPSSIRVRLERALTDAALDVEPEAAVEAAAFGIAAATMLAFAVAPGLAPVVLGAGLVSRARGPAARARACRAPVRRRAPGRPRAGRRSTPRWCRCRTRRSRCSARIVRSPGTSRASSRAPSSALSLADALAAWPQERPLPERARRRRRARRRGDARWTCRRRASTASPRRCVSALGALAEAACAVGPGSALGDRRRRRTDRVRRVQRSGRPVRPSTLLVGTDVGRVCLLCGIGCEALGRAVDAAHPAPGDRRVIAVVLAAGVGLSSAPADRPARATGQQPGARARPRSRQPTARRHRWRRRQPGSVACSRTCRARCAPCSGGSTSSAGPRQSSTRSPSSSRSRSTSSPSPSARGARRTSPSTPRPGGRRPALAASARRRAARAARSAVAFADALDDLSRPGAAAAAAGRRAARVRSVRCTGR